MAVIVKDPRLTRVIRKLIREQGYTPGQIIRHVNWEVPPPTKGQRPRGGQPIPDHGERDALVAVLVTLISEGENIGIMAACKRLSNGYGVFAYDETLNRSTDITALETFRRIYYEVKKRAGGVKVECDGGSEPIMQEALDDQWSAVLWWLARHRADLQLGYSSIGRDGLYFGFTPTEEDIPILIRAAETFSDWWR